MTTDTAKGADARPPLLLVAGSLVAFWVVLWLTDSYKDYLAARLAGQPVSLSYALCAQSPWWGAWALLAPVAALIAWWFPPAGPRWKVRLAGHCVTACVMGTAHLSLASTLFRWRAADLSGPAVYRHFVGLFTNYMTFDLVAYLGMVGVVAAWTYYRGMRDREGEAVRLAVRAAELERGMSEARLEALRRQLHPHFLFNTLNTVASLARRGEIERVTNMLERLGDLLRLRLHDDQPDEITLETELEWMDHYLAIERERFGDRLDVLTTVPRELRSALVPAMLLQPLVENAVRHGIAAEEGRGQVDVAACRDGERLVITVSDSGPGFGRAWSPEGIGLSNTRARLAQLYGDRATLYAGNGNGHGGRVTVGIPWHTESNGGPEP